MGLPCYLAMTSAEFAHTEALPAHTAWMACHFSCYGTGLCNLPEQLPRDSMVILNDRTPPQGHDPLRITEQLSRLLEQLEVPCVLLDFQRMGYAETEAIVQKLSLELQIPMAVSEPYAAYSDRAVFLRCPPPHELLSKHLEAWHDREIWLEIATEHEIARLTTEGCIFSTADDASLPELPFRDPRLHCHYTTEVFADHALFTLRRGTEDIPALLTEAEQLGVTRAVGLYQQLWNM